MSTSGPKITDVKLLFARSGNRCAFPKCKAPLAIDDTLVGEICHIKGARPGSARYDAVQMAAERHHRNNLVLMCGTHHTVIDDDETSYSVERLLQIKRDHEERATNVPDEEISRIEVSLKQSVLTVGQTGGLSAHTVQAKNIMVQAPNSNSNITNRQIQAVENLWQILQRFSSEFSMVVFVDTIFLPEEMDSFFSGSSDASLMDSVLEYRNMSISVAKMMNAGDERAAAERPFVSQRLWAVYFAIRAMYGRTSLLLANSFKDGYYVNWRSDSGCDQLLRAVLPANIVEHLKALPVSGLRSALDCLEDQFLAEAGMRNAQKL